MPTLKDKFRGCIAGSWIGSAMGAPPEGWPRWTDKQIGDADFVLMICTKTYYLHVMGEETPGTGLGLGGEGNLIYQHI